MKKPLSVKEALQRAGRYCALRERSPTEVSEKVTSWGLSHQEAQEVVDQLIDMGYVDAQRFANAFCHDKFAFQSWGKQKIKAHIYAHKLPAELITQALDRIDIVQYTQRLHALAERKWDALGEMEEAKKKQRVIAFLSQKGFEIDLIWEAVRNLSG